MKVRTILQIGMCFVLFSCLNAADIVKTYEGIWEKKKSGVESSYGFVVITKVEATKCFVWIELKNVDEEIPKLSIKGFGKLVDKKAVGGFQGIRLELDNVTSNINYGTVLFITFNKDGTVTLRLDEEVDIAEFGVTTFGK